MSTYTMRLHELIEMRGGHTSIVDGVRVLDKPSLLHLDTYPIFDEAHRAELNGFILDTYWNREIAHESADIFIQQLRVKLRIIMPTYNKMYESLARDIDPLVTTDIRVTSEGTGETSSTRDAQAESESGQSSKSRSASSDTPSQMLASDGHYVSSAVDTITESTNTTTATDGSTASESSSSVGESRTIGYNGSPAELLRAYRESLVNIDEMVVAELEPLFFMMWGSPHMFTGR